MNYTPSHEILEKYIGMTLIDFFVSHLRKNSAICMFGYGETGKNIFECMTKKGIDVCCICDNNWAHIDDVNVISPEKATRENPNAIFLVSSRRYSYEMELQLLKLGITDDMIVSYDYSSELSYRGMLPEAAYGKMVSAMHYEITGKYPNLEEPKTFNEKMISSMIKLPMNDRTELADKFKVRSWVADKIGEKYLVKLYGDWKKIDDIPWADLPKQYALKLNHGSGYNIISDGTYKVDVGIAKRKLKCWMRCNFGYVAYERHYIPIEPHIICEEYIENVDNDVYDYKIFCFHGEPQFIMFLSERKKGLKMIFFDLDWKVMPFVYTYPKGDFIPHKPKRFEEMLAVTKILCKDFDQVRVDWYIFNDGRIKFGEMTFTSAAGHAKWNPLGWDMRLGEMW